MATKHDFAGWCASKMAMTKKAWAMLNSGEPLTIVKRGRDVIAVVWADSDKDEQEFGRLLSAAPELLDALERLQIQMSNLLLFCDLPQRFADGINSEQAQARAAIAKAKGE